MSEQAGRYQRSFSGLIGAIVITLLAIGGFVAVRAFVRDDQEAVSGRGNFRKAEDFDRLCRAGFLDAKAAVVVERANAP